MNHHTTYHKQDPNYRVVSAPHGMWVAQQRCNMQGTRECDPWENMHGPKPYDVAIAVMYQRQPLTA